MQLISQVKGENAAASGLSTAAAARASTGHGARVVCAASWRAWLSTLRDGLYPARGGRSMHAVTGTRFSNKLSTLRDGLYPARGGRSMHAVTGIRFSNKQSLT